MKKLEPFPMAWVMLLAALSLPASASQARDQTTPVPVKKAEMPGISNFSRVDGAAGFGGAMVGFGGATQPSAMAGLTKAGFAAVINLRVANEPGADVDASRAAAEAAGLKYIHLPFDAANPDPKLVDTFLAAVGETSNQPVYIHCASATRVAGLWMIARVLKDGWEVEQAEAEASAIALKPAVAIAFATQYIASQGK